MPTSREPCSPSNPWASGKDLASLVHPFGFQGTDPFRLFLIVSCFYGHKTKRAAGIWHQPPNYLDSEPHGSLDWRSIQLISLPVMTSRLILGVLPQEFSSQASAFGFCIFSTQQRVKCTCSCFQDLSQKTICLA